MGKLQKKIKYSISENSILPERCMARNNVESIKNIYAEFSFLQDLVKL